MKYYVILLTVTLCALTQALIPLSQEEKEELRAWHKECKTSTGVDEELLKKTRNGEFADDPKLKEQMYCVFKKVGFMSDSGELDMEFAKTKLRKNMDEQETATALSCMVKQSTPQETALYVKKCWYEKNLKLGPTN